MPWLRVATVSYIQPTGWFAKRDDDGDAPDGSPWRPWVQVVGMQFPLEGIWFSTERQCLDWIRREVIGRGMFDE